MHTFDLKLEEITKIEGAASLDIKVVEGKVQEVDFKITEFKRFYTQAIRGKPLVSLPQMLARICGTCSNAHLLCSIEACEKALGIQVSPQTELLKILTIYGLMLRDHALHLYLFALPDIFNKDSFLEFNESDSLQHQLLHDGFEVKSAGNLLSTVIAGRSVHAPFPTIGGFLHFPTIPDIQKVVSKLESVRPAVLRLIDVLEKSPFHFDRKTNFMALVSDRYGFLKGKIGSSQSEIIPEEKFAEHLERIVLPYSQASAYTHHHQCYMVGALARLNLAKDKLHPQTKTSLQNVLNLFPSTDIFHNNLAQAIEILHSIDDSLELLKTIRFQPEPIIKKPPQRSVGVGVIEAPRGTLYHRVEIDETGKVVQGEIVVPTGQNQINIQEDIYRLVEELLPKMEKEKIPFEIEKLIRAYDPCMSCAAHFLKVRWL